MNDTEDASKDNDQKELLTKEDIEDIRYNAITHIASTVYKKTLARLDSSPEHHDKPDDEKKKFAYELVKKSLNESYGVNLRTDLIKINTLREEVISDISDIIVTEEETSEDAEDLEEET